MKTIGERHSHINQVVVSGIDRNNMIASVFSSLQGLEKCLKSSKKMYDKEFRTSALVEQALSQQSLIIVDMRRTANKLQIHLAKKDWDGVVRTLRVFYGLRQIVRPEIMSTFQSLANRELHLPQLEDDSVVH